MELTKVAIGRQPTYDRTLTRAKVHRTAVAEVFITDSWVSGPGQVRVAAQTPPCHAYFGDHLPEPVAVDPLLLMEICRQAGLASAYELGIPVSTTLATSDWDLHLDEGNFVPWGAAADLVVDSEFEWGRIRNGLPRTGRCRQQVTYDGRTVAELDASSSFLSPDQLQAIRRAQRGSAPPWTNELPGRDIASIVAPEMVGRRLPQNVVLAELSGGEGSATAKVLPAVDNRALFDHAYDHVTMQVLAEAARQLTVAAAPVAPHSGAWCIRRQRARFERFAELDAPTVVTADVHASGGSLVSTVRALQEDRTVATFELSFVAGDVR